jgi:hypothetical protein
MASYNKYAKIFQKWKDILTKDERTSQFQVYGGEYSKKKTMPCIVIFPELKTWKEDPGTRSFRKAGLPKEVVYTFNFWVYISILDLEDSYYNESIDEKAGLTQILTELEAVLKDHKTANDLYDSTIQLWFDTSYTSAEISQRPGKLMHGRISVDFITKELA